ncbi:DEAD/DEAH box helicase family protein, partial [Thermus scotoductus]
MQAVQAEKVRTAHHAEAAPSRSKGGTPLTLAQFMSQHGRDLLAQAQSTFPPAVRVPDPGLVFPGRKPMGAQALAVSGAVHALRSGERAVFVVGEMGTGKTFMGIATALNAFPGGRYLVLCPPHLVAKWAREAEMEGAEAVVLERPRDVKKLQGRKGPLFAILSRERAKLGPGWRPALVRVARAVQGEVRRVPACPDCFTPLTPEDAEATSRRRLRCERCGASLWQETEPRRESVYHALKRLLPKGFFHLLLLDEAHEYKGGTTAQALTAAGLMDWVGRTLLLTGTLFGGYASGLYHLLRRALPEVREDWPTEAGFVAQFGLLERVYSERWTWDGRYTRRREGRSTTKERPGL